MSSSWKSRVIESFGDKSAIYNQHNVLQRSVAQKLAHHLPDISAPDVLEIGCGTGVFTRHLLEKYPEARFHITDVSVKMLEDVKQEINREDIKWSVMDGEAPQLGNKYDLIVGNMVLQWFENPYNSLANLATYLKPSGVLLYSVPSSKSFPEWSSSLDKLSLPNGFLKHVDWRGVFLAEDIAVDYGSTFDFLRSFKQTGANIPNADYQAMSAYDLRRVCRLNDIEHGGWATWNILFGRLKNEGVSE